MLLLTTKVVGLTFNNNYPKNVFSLAKEFALGNDAIDIMREPHNPVDSNAIGVYSGGKKIGHLPKDIAEFIAPQMDAGIQWNSAVESIVISQENTNNPGVKITLWSDQDEE